MRKKINENDEVKKNLLGYASVIELYNQLLRNADFVFPEYGIKAKECISRHTANLIKTGVYSTGQLVELHGNSNSRNVRLIKHLEKLAQKGLAVYAKRYYKGKFKLNIDKIKSDWLDINYKKSDDELQAEAINRTNLAIKKILNMIQKYDCYDVTSQIASNLEFLVASLDELFQQERK